MENEIIITGDTTHKALEKIINKCISKLGKDLKIKISKNLRFDKQRVD